MKNYEVTIRLIVDPSRDVNLKEPETTEKTVIVSAKSENEARQIARDNEESGLSIWETYACEI